MNIFILLKTPMITDQTWMMIMTLWPILTLILSLGQLSFLNEIKPEAPKTYTMKYLG